MSSIGAGSFHSSALVRYTGAVPSGEYADPQDLVETVYARTQEEEEKIAEGDALQSLDEAVGLSSAPLEKRQSVLDLKGFFEQKSETSSPYSGSPSSSVRGSTYDPVLEAANMPEKHIQGVQRKLQDIKNIIEILETRKSTLPPPRKAAPPPTPKIK